MEQVSFVCQRNLPSLQAALVGCSSGIVLANKFGASMLFTAELENRLEEVDIQPPILVNAF